MAGMLSTLSIISVIVAIVFLVLAIVFWFLFNIPAVISDLTGRTARKSIEKMREANEKSGKKAYKESKVNAGRGKLTGAIPTQPETGLLIENRAERYEGEETGVLGDETSLLVTDETALLNDEKETVPLVVTDMMKNKVRTDVKKFKLLEEVLLVHTDEVIVLTD